MGPRIMWLRLGSLTSRNFVDIPPSTWEGQFLSGYDSGRFFRVWADSGLGRICGRVPIGINDAPGPFVEYYGARITCLISRKRFILGFSG